MNGFECPASSTVLQAVDWAARKLDGRADPGSRANSASRVESELLLGKVRASSRLDLYLHHDRRLDVQESSRFSALVSRRMRGEPVQYLTGSTEFYGREFAVSPDVLIPRPETERLVDHVRPFLDALRRRGTRETVGRARPRKAGERRSIRTLRFADIGTGAGVLAVTLALECPFVRGYATDVSEEALGVARKNAENLLQNRRSRITFRKGPLLAALNAPAVPAFDLIVSNPPYVASGEMDGLPEEIRRFEPRLALHGGEDGLECHRALIEQAPGHLKRGGMIALEIGAEQSGAVTRLMADRRGYDNVMIVKDYNGLDRIVSAVYAG